MKALSIRQPWAWLILHAGKDVENRTWPTNVRGRVLIHAPQGMTRREFEDAVVSVDDVTSNALFAARDNIERGGIVGSVEIVGCSSMTTNSRWFSGPYGFVLRDPQPLPFKRCRGQLGFFDVDYEKLS